jgi:hypothetical protein
MGNIILYLLQVKAEMAMLSLTLILIFNAVFFTTVLLIIINNRKSSDMRHNYIATEVEGLKQLMLGEYKDIIVAIKDLKS